MASWPMPADRQYAVNPSVKRSMRTMVLPASARLFQMDCGKPYRLAELCGICRGTVAHVTATISSVLRDIAWQKDSRPIRASQASQFLFFQLAVFFDIKTIVGPGHKIQILLFRDRAVLVLVHRPQQLAGVGVPRSCSEQLWRLR